VSYAINMPIIKFQCFIIYFVTGIILYVFREESSKEWTSLLYILSREDTFEDQCSAGFKELVTR